MGVFLPLLALRGLGIHYLLAAIVPVPRTQTTPLNFARFSGFRFVGLGISYSSCTTGLGIVILEG